ncbi:MAG: hypothetical protein OHK0012_09750 [Synechococcales cyanobacterium]
MAVCQCSRAVARDTWGERIKGSQINAVANSAGIKGDDKEGIGDWTEEALATRMAESTEEYL